MMKRISFLHALAILAGCGKPAAPAGRPSIPERIVSMAPNITETIYALGLGDKLVGATTFCTYPEAARSVPRIGGFGQFNFEAIVALRPDLVILHREYDAEQKRLDGLGIPHLETGSYFIGDILETIRAIGSACGAEGAGQELADQLNARVSQLRKHIEKPPRVLITFGGSAGDEIEQIHAFGTECIHNELLEIAGGENVVRTRLPYSILSREAVLRLNPDIIIQLAPGQEAVGDPSNAWKKMADVAAVRNGQVYLLTGDYTCIPGPRFIQTLEDFSRIIGGPHE
jgi:iron complex transport system substrate-binding protein